MRQNLTNEELRCAPLEVIVVDGATGGDSGGLTDAELRAAPVPVSGTVTANVGTVPVTGPLTDAQLRASSVAVTFSNSSLAVTGPLTDAQMRASAMAVSGPLTDTQLRASAVPVSGTVGVSGTIAVSGPLTDAQLRASAVSVAFTNSSLAVTGPLTDTQLRATAVPVSGTVAATQSGTWNIGAITTLPALPAGTNLIGRAQPQYAARVVRNFILDAFTAAPVADALQPVVQWYNNAAVAGATAPAVVPAGKILKLTSWGIETKSLATVGSVVVRVRANASGTVLIGSPIAGSFSAGSIAGATTTAMTGAFCSITGDFGEGGLEFPAGTGIGFSMAGYGPTGTLTLEGVTRFWVYGFEYTA